MVAVSECKPHRLDEHLRYADEDGDASFDKRVFADALINCGQSKPWILPILFVVLGRFVAAELMEGAEEDRAVRRVYDDSA
jgi:hypothetical protein